MATEQAYLDLAGLGTFWDSIKIGLRDLYYPVGSYYETSDVDFDPNTEWGGTWVLEAAGQVHVSAGTGYTIGDTGGSKDAIIPLHNHTASGTAIADHAATKCTGAAVGDHAATKCTGAAVGDHAATKCTGGDVQSKTLTGSFNVRYGNGTSADTIMGTTGIVSKSNTTWSGTHGVMNLSNIANPYYNVVTITATHDHGFTQPSTPKFTHTVTQPSTPKFTHTVTQPSTPVLSHTVTQPTISSEGTDVTDANMPPYIVVNRWHRTA